MSSRFACCTQSGSFQHLKRGASSAAPTFQGQSAATEDLKLNRIDLKKGTIELNYNARYLIINSILI